MSDNGCLSSHPMIFHSYMYVMAPIQTGGVKTFDLRSGSQAMDI